MTHYDLKVTCLYDGYPVEHVNGTSNGLLAVTIVRCPECNREYELTTRITPLARPESVRRNLYARSAS